MKWRTIMDEKEHYVPVTDLVTAAGYSRTSIGTLLEELTTAPGLGVNTKKMKLAHGRPAWVVFAHDADAVFAFLVERRKKHAAFKRERDEEPPEPVDVFEATVRKLIHLCAERKIDSLTIQDGQAEIVRTVTITKQETIKP